MIIYFTGTGNSRYVAKRIARSLDDELLCINDRIKNESIASVDAGERLVVVTPTYAWRIPRIVSDWIEKTELKSVKKVWYVMTCGDSNGNADAYNSRLSNSKRWEHMGTFRIRMPENYIAMFSVPGVNEASRIVGVAEHQIDKAIKLIASNEVFPKRKRTIRDRLESGIVNDVFYPLIVKAKDFKADSNCTGCGCCVRLCPLNNVSLVNGKPHWKSNCTHCMACIAYCPSRAVEYGKKSIGKPRYNFEKLGIRE